MSTIKISLSSGLKFYMLKKIFLVVSNFKLIIVFVAIVCSGLKWNFLWYERSYPSKDMATQKDEKEHVFVPGHLNQQSEVGIRPHWLSLNSCLPSRHR